MVCPLDTLLLIELIVRHNVSLAAVTKDTARHLVRFSIRPRNEPKQRGDHLREC